MKKLTEVIATNAIITLPDGSREVIADEALEDLATQINNGGGRPQLIEHDWHRLCGWCERAWTERDGQSLRVVTESLIPEHDEERRVINQKYRAFLNAWATERLEPFEHVLDSFKIPGCSLTFDTDCVYLRGPSLAKRLCADMFAKVDEDGLIPVSASDFDESGHLLCNGYFLVPSRFLRPSFALPNPLNSRFLASFAEAAKTLPSSDVRLALDPDLLGIPASYRPMEQRDFWWGPPYRGRPSQQPYGVTVHGPTRYDGLSGLIRTEFWWYGKTERTVEIEELIDRPCESSGSGSTREMRFVHSIFDGTSDVSRHLDGAVRSYTDLLWEKRLAANSNISNFGKQATRAKIWRVDGALPTAVWYDLIHMFFRGNFTVAEYFGLPDPEVYRSTLKS